MSLPLEILPPSEAQPIATAVIGETFDTLDDVVPGLFGSPGKKRTSTPSAPRKSKPDPKPKAKLPIATTGATKTLVTKQAAKRPLPSARPTRRARGRVE